MAGWIIKIAKPTYIICCPCTPLSFTADKEWKRKYFQEKKFTSTLEDRIKRSKDDIQQLQGHLDRRQGNHLKGRLTTTRLI